jgi:hypothetical protein
MDGKIVLVVAAAVAVWLIATKKINVKMPGAHLACPCSRSLT